MDMQAIYAGMYELLNAYTHNHEGDSKFRKQLTMYATTMRREFGKGYALFEVGDLQLLSQKLAAESNVQLPDPDSGVPGFYLDEEYTYRMFGNDKLGFSIWNYVKDLVENSLPHQLVVLFITYKDLGESAPERYVVAAKPWVFDLSDTKELKTRGFGQAKPSKMTEAKIRKLLNAMWNSGQRLLILDTSLPDFTGKNLAKWMQCIKQMSANEDKHFSVMVDSSPDNPADLPESLKSDVLTVNFK